VVSKKAEVPYPKRPKGATAKRDQNEGREKDKQRVERKSGEMNVRD